MCVRTNCSFKLSTTCLIIFSITHFIGLMVPMWSTFEVSAGVGFFSISGTYRSGLWSDCACLMIGCVCFPKIYMPDWLNAVRAMEVLGLIGMLLSALNSFIICCCYNKGKLIRQVNICCVGTSGTFIVIGVIIFGIENNKDFQNMFSFIDKLPLGLDAHGSLSGGFYSCTLAGCICLAVCVPLLVYDYRNPIPPAVQSVANPMVFPYTAVNIPPVQTAVVNTSNPNQFGYMPAYVQAQPVNEQPGPAVQGAYAYKPQPGYVHPGPAVQGTYAYQPQPGYVHPGPAVQGTYAYQPQPGYVQPGPVVQGEHAYTPQPGYLQPGHAVQGAHADTPQPVDVQAGSAVQEARAYTPQPCDVQPDPDMEKPPPYTTQDLPSGSQNLHQDKDLPCKSSII